MFVKIKDMEAYKKELGNDYIITKQLSSLSGRLYLMFGRLLALANVVITAKHIDYDAYKEEKDAVKLAQQSSTTAEELLTNSEQQHN